VSGTLRIGLVYDDTVDRPGGIGLYVTTLGAALSRRGHHVEYLLGTSQRRSIDALPAHALARNVRVRFNGNVLSMPAWSRASHLDRALTCARFDVLHVQVPYSPLMAGRLLDRCDNRCAVVGTYHVASDHLVPRAGALALRAFAHRWDRRFDRMLAVSETAARFARQYSRLRIDDIAPNLLDASAFRAQAHGGARAEHPQGSADVVFVGRLVPRKGVIHLLRAVAAIGRRPGNVMPRVAILGDGPLRGQLERASAGLGLGAHVTFLGAVDDETKAAVLRRATIACFPSLFGESFGMVILEALAAGAQVVLGGDNPGYRELLGDDRALVDPCDEDAFADRLHGLLTSSDLRASVGRAQRDRMRRFDVETVTDQVEQAYHLALQRRRSSRSIPAASETGLAMV